MTGAYFLVPMLLVIGISYLVVRGAAVALMMTGLDEKRARFQALSAFTGTGFTTQEAELVVNHPQRRRIVTWLMILGNAGLVTVIVTATSSLVTSTGYHIGITAFALVLGIFLVFRILSRNALVRRWEGYIHKHLIKRRTIEVRTIEEILQLREGYGLLQVHITSKSPYLGSAIGEIKAGKEGFRVLGIERQSEWIPFPEKTERVQPGDLFIIYGHLPLLSRVFQH
ncbi:MAG: TrkA C-terminal domain-containing protein [Dehalococcoidia bacterium]